MNYPFWDVPHFGSGWVIGMIAIFHIMISHFAIGGGFYLVLAEQKALRENRPDWIEALKRHSKFFLILTGVYGAMSGVAIWFSIGLANPEATSTLIHNFVFGWAIEWTFFIMEVMAALVYYYTWDRVSNRTHLIVGWVYAINAWLSLVIINGILTFMLTPGQTWLSVAGTGHEASKFWNAFFNPTYWPSLFVRTLICISLAGVWALVTSSRLDAVKQRELKTELVRWSAKWLMPSFLLLPLCLIWYLYMIPADSKQLLQLGISTIGQGVFTQVTRAVLVTTMTSGTIAGVVYFLAYRNPRQFHFGHAVAILILALSATASTEHAREMLRKPFVIGQHMYSNGVRKADVPKYNKDGYLLHSPWATKADRELWAQVDAMIAALPVPAPTAPATPAATPAANTASTPSAAPAVAAPAAPAAPAPALVLTADQQAAQLRRGELMLRGQCLACHTRDVYRPLKKLLAGRDRESVASFLKILHEQPKDSTYNVYMPPLVGSAGEISALADFLTKLIAKQGGEQQAPAADKVARISQP